MSITPERLTWQEIKEKYPHQYVGLVDIEYLNNDGVGIETAVVKYTSDTLSYEELLEKAVIVGEITLRYTTLDEDNQLGGLQTYAEID